MSDNEIQSIKEQLDGINKSMLGMDENINRILFCLMGDLKINGGCGLLAEHHERGKRFDSALDKIDKLETHVDDLREQVKRWRWLAIGACAVIVTLFSFYDRYVTQHQIKLNPQIIQKP